ncbi:CBM35 domain-containing protein [Actinomycetes bacterium KLBMP 9797]
MVDGREKWLAEMAKAGHRRALDELIERYEPLVCHIVVLGLSGEPSVEGAIRRVIERVEADPPAPDAVRAGFAAATVRQVRELRRQRQPSLVAAPVEALGVYGEVRAVVEAARWLAPHDRDVFALWWLTETGDLTAGDVATALGLTPDEGAARVRRMRVRLDTARRVTAALAVDPVCTGLVLLAGGAAAGPQFQRRERLARHLDECERCGAGHTAGLAPAGPLLAEAGLAPAFGPAVRRQPRAAVVPAVSVDTERPARRFTRGRRRARTWGTRWATAAVLAALAVVVVVMSLGDQPAPQPAADPTPSTVEPRVPDAPPRTTADPAPLAPAAAATPIGQAEPSPSGPPPTTPATSPAPTAFSFEAEGARLSGAAAVTAMAGASGGRVVHRLGTERSPYGYPVSGTIEFTGVTVPAAGRYSMTVYYVSGENRSAYYQVNGGSTYSRSFAAGSWEAVSSLTFGVDLRAGTNTITFGNPYHWMPRLDRLHLTLA